MQIQKLLGRNSYRQSAALTHTCDGKGVKEQCEDKIRQATNCVALNPEGNHSNGSGLINLCDRSRDGVGSFMASAQSHAAQIIFQRKAFSYFTWFLLYDTNSLQRAMFLLILYSEQFKQIYEPAL